MATSSCLQGDVFYCAEKIDFFSGNNGAYFYLTDQEKLRRRRGKGCRVFNEYLLFSGFREVREEQRGMWA